VANRKKILAIPGSTRQKSTNLNLLKEIAALTSDQLAVELFEGLAEIPHFNPDLDNENPPAAVFNFRRLIKEADGVLICTPEYAMGVPGTLKNAIDWTVSSAEFSHKPVALITASSMGQKAHLSLLETLRIIECDIPEDSQLLISFVKTKVSSEGKITNEETSAQVQKLLASFIAGIEKGNSSL
jgi:chromate reductase